MFSRLPIYILFLLIPCLLFGQNTSSITSKIDSLVILKSKIEKELDEINAQIKQLENDRLQIEMDSESQGVPAFLKLKAKLKAEPNYGAEVIKEIDKGDSVTVFGYKTSHFKVKHENDYGYIYIQYFYYKAPNLSKVIEAGKAEEAKLKYEQNAEKREQKRIEDELKKKQAEEARIARKKKEEEDRKKRNEQLIKKYGKTNGQKIIDKKIWIGMTSEMALESWGKPQDINRTVGSFGVHEQWVYGDTYLYFEDGKLTSWQD